jgi:hypothetical protein
MELAQSTLAEEQRLEAKAKADAEKADRAKALAAERAAVIASLSDLNEVAAKAQGVTPDQFDARYTFQQIGSGMWTRGGAVSGITVKVGGYDAQARNYKLKDDGSINTARLTAVLKERYEAKAARVAAKAKKSAAVAAAGALISEELELRIARAAGTSERLEFALTAEGMISAEWRPWVYPAGGGRGYQTTRSAGTPRSVQAWTLLCEAKEACAAILKELNDKAESDLKAAKAI